MTYVQKAGGEKVRRGLYLDKEELRIRRIEHDGDRLPGDPSRKYLYLTVLEMLVFAVVMGGLFVLFVPAVGLVVVLGMLLGCAALFLLQKLICKGTRYVCRAEYRLSALAYRYFPCKQCPGKCDDNPLMIVRAVTIAIVLLTGMAIYKYVIGC